MLKLVIIDFNRTLYDPINKGLFKGSIDLLQYLKKLGVLVIVYSTENHKKNEQIQKYTNNLVTDIKLTEKKLASDIQNFMNRHSASAVETLIVGDDPEAELLFGAKMAIPTVAVGTGFCTEEAANKLGLKFIATIASLYELLQGGQL